MTNTAGPMTGAGMFAGVQDYYARYRPPITKAVVDAILLGGMIGQVQKGKLETVFPTEARSAAPVYPAQAWDSKA